LKRESTPNTNLAAEFYIASQLFRLGYTVTITLGHTKEIDLFVGDQRGRVIPIDVKGLKNTTNWPVKPKLISKTHYFILVCYKNKFNEPSSAPEVFIIPSRKINPLLGKWSGNPNVTAIGYSKIRNSKYKNAWKLLSK
jgi:hypothetical protein